MESPAKGMFVTRLSHGCDLIFEVMQVENPERIVLRGVTTRLMADAPAADLLEVPEASVFLALARMEKEGFAKKNAFPYGKSV